VFKYRFIILTIILAWSGSTCYFITQLGPLTEQEIFIPDDHPVMKAADLAEDQFFSGDSDLALRIEFVWGVEGLDKDGVSMWDPQNLGSVIWDKCMDLSREAN